MSQYPECGHKTPMPMCGSCYVFPWFKEVRRLKALIGSSLLALGSARRRILAVRKEHPSSVKLAAAQEKLDQVINVFEALVVGDTPTPGAQP